MTMREVNSADRLEKLKALSELLAEKMDEVFYIKDLPPLARQYRETIREIEEIEGNVSETDEIAEILHSREVNGKSGAVRKSKPAV